MPIDLAAVNWAYVAILSLIAFVAALLGSLISFRNRFGGAVVAAILFAAAFVFWTYYPHPQLPGPLTVGDVSAAATAPAAAPAAAATRPANPVSTMSQAPSNPVSTMSQPPANPATTMNPPAATAPPK
ncbi:MAG TPA: hypothetical protein VMC05_07105 [Xanthobacteraceae bacterium]|nr:hypothetical protein [Xanthobacteraceae bacterium]